MQTDTHSHEVVNIKAVYCNSHSALFSEAKRRSIVWSKFPPEEEKDQSAFTGFKDSADCGEKQHK